jgi:N-methylhydantoinase B/oxoprolinase/acetone carboxylase alpha subunit
MTMRNRITHGRHRVQPIEFDVFKHLFLSIADEMGATLRQTGFSPNIKERLDYSCAVYDRDGETIAQGDHMPVHLGAMPLSVRAAIDAVPMEPGDAVMLNDPFQGGTHLPDITLVSPVCLPGDRRPTFFVANRAHHSDVGGMSAGSMPVASEIFQEGLILPPVRLVRRGRIVPDVMAIVLANVRTPDERRGDLSAQIAANRVAATRLHAAATRYGAARLLASARALQSHTERAVRATLRAIPAGRYRFEDRLDDDGFSEDPLKVAVAVTIRNGRVTMDFTGSSRQAAGSVNANLAITWSACLYALRCLVREDVLYNAGVSRPLSIIAPAGTVVNASRPAAVAGGNVEASQRITDVVFGALARALPDRIPAASQGTMNNITFGGVDPRTGRRFAYYETLGGGMGARPDRDGLSALHTHMSNTRNTPIEAIELDLPIRVTEYRIRRGSGGEGRFRGGDGLIREYESLTHATVTILSDRRRFPPYGVRGGAPGARGRNVLIRDGREESLPGKIELRLRPGDRLRIETPGGGGYGRAADGE